jgi:hypothetical protein
VHLLRQTGGAWRAVVARGRNAEGLALSDVPPAGPPRCDRNAGEDDVTEAEYRTEIIPAHAPSEIELAGSMNIRAAREQTRSAMTDDPEPGFRVFGVSQRKEVPRGLCAPDVPPQFESWWAHKDSNLGPAD